MPLGEAECETLDRPRGPRDPPRHRTKTFIRRRPPPLCMSLDGKAVAVTGAGSGMGEQTARTFARRGADVAVVDIDSDAAGETVAAIRADTDAEAVAVTADVSAADDVAGVINRTGEAFGAIDGLHNPSLIHL